LRLPLDTHVVLWWLRSSTRLPPTLYDLVADRSNDVFVSVVTVRELAIKRALGRLHFERREVVEVCDQEGLLSLPIGRDHALAAGALPRHHNDAFDRMLIAQSRIEGITLVSADRHFGRYDVDLMTI
jgi:PIN domain nuclease of toxin-antitoxin system